MNLPKIYFTYLLTNHSNKLFYVGMTNNLELRVQQHKTKFNDGFTKRYNIDKLVYFETFNWVQDAIKREKQIKKYSRLKKTKLIESINPEWNELSAP